MASYDFTFKILLLGDDLSGKQYITDSYCYNLFNRPGRRLTIGVDFHVKTIRIDNRIVKMQLFTVGGQERFRFLLPTYCLGANGAMIIYDTSNFNSLDNSHAFLISSFEYFKRSTEKSFNQNNLYH